MRILSSRDTSMVNGGTWSEVTVDYTSNNTATVTYWGHAGEQMMTITGISIDQAEEIQRNFNESKR